LPQQTYDAVVIGAGAGGGAAALSLCNRKLRVLVLEAGPAYDPARDYRLGRNDWEKDLFPYKPGSSGRQTFAPLQALDDRWDDLRSWNRVTGRTNTTDRRQPIAYHHVRGVGGSTLHFTGESHRLNPQAMRMRSRFGVAADWPFDYAELEPFYCEAERIIGVAGPARDSVRWRSEPYPLPAHELSYASSKLVAGSRKLGLDWGPNSVAVLSRPYDGRPGCNYCNNCARGCPRRDKGSVDVTFMHKALESGICTLRTRCQVTRIETGPADRVTGVLYVDSHGKQQLAVGACVIVACGAVETPRLLLASGGKDSADGLANESGQVGRNFMETLLWNSSALHSEPLASYRGLPSDSICWDYNAPDAIPGVVGGCRFSTSVAEANLLGPANYAKRVVGGWGKAHKERMRDEFGRVLTVGAIGESLPDENSFVDLDPNETDAAGTPLARIHSHIDERELDRLTFMAKMTRQILEASGADERVEEYGTYDYFSSTHVFGTCRMGENSETSVVDSYCRSHRWRNLFIVDASIFPSSGGGESPSLTIEALALRAAAHISGLAKRKEL
jgi:choline dehydrogenase-like flavoprotein